MKEEHRDQRWTFLNICAVAMLSLTGCEAPAPTDPGDDDDDTPLDCVDHRQDWEPRLSESYFIEVPTILIPSGSEAIHCFYGTYEGPDAGIVSFLPEEPEGFLHHSLMKRVDDNEFPDGTFFDCSAEEFQFPPKPTLVEAYNPSTYDWVGLPEGIGFKLEHGQRWVADVHYINTSPDPICFNTAFELELVEAEDLIGYAGTFNLDGGGLALPPNQESSVTFDCAWPHDVNVLSIAGHMHSNGLRYNVDQVLDEDLLENIYHVDPWFPGYRYEAPLRTFDLGEFVMSEGEALRTECTWYNPTSEPMGYPDEMCTTFGVAFPLEDSLHCDAGVILGGH